MSTGYEDSFYVMVDGAPKMMTLDELVEAYEADVINGGTLVVEVGGSDWRPLSEVADLGDDEAEAAPESAPAEVVASPSLAVSSERRPAISNPPPAGSAPERRPAMSNPPPVNAGPAMRPAISNPPPAGSAYPGAARSQAPISVAPASMAPISQAPLSTAPFVQDLDFGDDMAFRKGRSKAPIFVALGVLVLGGGGAFAMTQSGTAPAPVPVPVAAAPAPVAAPTVESKTEAPAAPAKEATPSEDGSSAKGDGRLSDAMKEALLAQDKERASKKASGARARASGRSSSRSKSGGTDGVFRAGGSADDPLNSKL